HGQLQLNLFVVHWGSPDSGERLAASASSTSEYTGSIPSRPVNSNIRRTAAPLPLPITSAHRRPPNAASRCDVINAPRTAESMNEALERSTIVTAADAALPSASVTSPTEDRSCSPPSTTTQASPS